MPPASDSSGSLIPAGVPFTQIANDAITDPQIDAYALRVYAYLMHRANTTHRAWPSQRTIAADCHMSRNTTAKAIDTLRTEGWITVAVSPTATKHQQRHIYTVRGSKPARLPLEDNRPTTPTGSPREPAHDVTPTGSSREREPAHDVGRNNNHELQPENNNHSEVETTIATRKRDGLWEAIVACHGDPATPSERGKYNRAHKDLRGAEVTEREYPSLVAAYAEKHTRPNNPPPQPTVITIATRVGELRHYIQQGPIQAPRDTPEARRAQLLELIAEQEPAR